MRAGSRGRGSPSRSWPIRSRAPTIAPGSGENVVGSIHMSWATSGATLSAIAATTSGAHRRTGVEVWPMLRETNRFIASSPIDSVNGPRVGGRSTSITAVLRSGDVRLGRHSDEVGLVKHGELIALTGSDTQHPPCWLAPVGQ